MRPWDLRSLGSVSHLEICPLEPPSMIFVVVEGMHRMTKLNRPEIDALWMAALHSLKRGISGIIGILPTLQRGCSCRVLRDQSVPVGSTVRRMTHLATSGRHGFITGISASPDDSAVLKIHSRSAASRDDYSGAAECLKGGTGEI